MRGSGRSRIDAGLQLFAQNAHARLPHSGGESSPLVKQLQNDQVAVLVGHQAGQLVRLAEAEAAGVGLLIQQGLAAADCRAQT